MSDASRYFYKNVYTLEVDLHHIFGNAVIGATGSIANSSIKGGGITGIVRNSAGNYTISYGPKFNRFIGGQFGFLHTAIGTVAIVQVIGTPATFQADVKASKSITIQCIDYAGLAVDPDNGSVLTFRMDFRLSSIGKYDVGHL